MMASYVVVRIRGTMDVPSWADRTLEHLNLNKKFRATIVPDDPAFLGMLKRVKNYVAWCRVDRETVKQLLEKRAKKQGYKELDSKDLGRIGYKSVDDLAAALVEGKVTLSRIEGIKPWFALAPPRKGFKRKTKRMYQEHGILGENPQLLAIVRNMI